MGEGFGRKEMRMKGQPSILPCLTEMQVRNGSTRRRERMVRFQRTMKVKRGRHSMEWARELTDYVNTTKKRTKLELFQSRFGNLATICWICDFADLGTLEVWQKEVGSDPGYRELIKKSFDFVIAGTVEDTVFEAF
jgi:hypothetical protein